jgi:hypothetical protein
VKLRSRLARLERVQPKRCPKCRDREEFVMNVFRQDSLDAAVVPMRMATDMGPCVCGWAPEVHEIVEIVVHNREDVRRIAESGASFLGRERPRALASNGPAPI